MPGFILINEQTRCAKKVTRDQIRTMIDVRFNPGGYSDVDRCMAMVETAPYTPFPFQDRNGSRYTIHSEGRMDFTSNLRWRDPDHQCGPLCLIPEKERQIIQVVRG